MRMADPAVANNSSTSESDSAFARASALPRRLGMWSAVAVLVGSTIGSEFFARLLELQTNCPGRCLFSRSGLRAARSLSVERSHSRKSRRRFLGRGAFTFSSAKHGAACPHFYLDGQSSC